MGPVGGCTIYSETLVRVCYDVFFNVRTFHIAVRHRRAKWMWILRTLGLCTHRRKNLVLLLESSQNEDFAVKCVEVAVGNCFVFGVSVCMIFEWTNVCFFRQE